MKLFLKIAVLGLIFTPFYNDLGLASDIFPENPDSNPLMQGTVSTLPYHPPHLTADGGSRQNYPFNDQIGQIYPNTLKPRWRLPELSMPREVTPVIGYSVKEFGALGDGLHDDTHAFHIALNTMAAAGGGSVWVPAGHYRLSGTLDIPLNVCLEGEWAPPQPRQALKGSILMAYAGRNQIDSHPFIELQANCVLRNLSIWYPEQKGDRDPVPYPWTIYERPKNLFKACATVENVTLVNSYRGIFFGAAVSGHTNWYLRNIYGTPLESGIQIDMTNDTGRLYNIHFSTRFWAESGLPDAPHAKSPILGWVRKHGTAYIIRRQDFVHWGPFSADGYAVGLRGTGSLAVNRDGQEDWISKYGHDQFQGHFWGVNINNCGIAADLSELQEAGAAFTDCILEGEQIGVRIAPEAQYYTLFLRTKISGAEAALQSHSNIHLGFTNCSLQGPILSSNGSLALTNCEVVDSPLPPAVLQCSIQGGQIPPSWLKASLPSWKLDLSPLAYKMPEMDLPTVNLNPAINKVADRLFVLENDARQPVLEVGDRLQKLLDRASGMGGGIVFVPPGFYRLSQALKVPPQVELRGALDAPQHLARSPVVMLVDKNWATTVKPVLTLMEKSSLAGIGFFTPDQDWQNVQLYPWLLSAQGVGTRVRHLSAAGFTHLAEFTESKSRDFVVDTVNATILLEGFRIGRGTSNGRILNVHFISHPWALLNVAWRPEVLKQYWQTDLKKLPPMNWQPDPKGQEFMLALSKAFIPYRLGDAEGIFLFHNFTYACKNGLQTEFENGRGPNALVLHGAADYCQKGLELNAASAKGLLFTDFMIYCVDSQESIALQVDVPPQYPIVFENLQTVGETRKTLQLARGQLYFPSALFCDMSKSDTGRLVGGYFQLDGGEAILPGVWFFRHGVNLKLDPSAQMRILGGAQKSRFHIPADKTKMPIIRGLMALKKTI